MEEIRFVETPRCSVCKPDKSFRRRVSCVGCERLLPRPPRTAKRQEKQTRKRLGLTCELQVLLYRAHGDSYGAIAARMGLPRATVQSVVRRCTGQEERVG